MGTESTLDEGVLLVPNRGNLAPLVKELDLHMKRQVTAIGVKVRGLPKIFKVCKVPTCSLRRNEAR